MVVLGTRPEAIKLAPVIYDLAMRPAIDLTVCATAQHRDLLDQMLTAFGITPDIDLDLMQADATLDDLVGRMLPALGAAIADVQPDQIVVQGDTATAMAAAMAAHHRRVGLAHLEAGLRSGDLANPWPEEGYRRTISTLADLHFAPTASAAEALARENVDTARIYVTGNTVIDALFAMRSRIAMQPALASGLDPVVSAAAGRRILLVTLHRRENAGGGMAAIARALARIAARGDVLIVFPVHPGRAVADAVRPILSGLPGIMLLAPLDYPQFVRLLGLAHLALTDSGGVQEEAPAFGLPVLVLRERTERPEGVIAGTARLVGADEDRIVAETTALLDDPGARATMSRAHNPYGDGRAAGRIGVLLERG